MLPLLLAAAALRPCRARLRVCEASEPQNATVAPDACRPLRAGADRARAAIAWWGGLCCAKSKAMNQKLGKRRTGEGAGTRDHNLPVLTIIDKGTPKIKYNTRTAQSPGRAVVPELSFLALDFGGRVELVVDSVKLCHTITGLPVKLYHTVMIMP
eukprot:3227119-Rhodomonas_salina.1